MRNILIFLLMAFFITLSISCGGEKGSSENNSNASKENADPMTNKGIGPVKSLTLPAEIDLEMAKKGEEIYVAKGCTACHKPTEKYIGPAPTGVLERRSPEWIMNMILNPEEMIQKDPIAKQLLMEFNGSPMANQNLTQEEARAVLEYFRTLK